MTIAMPVQQRIHIDSYPCTGDQLVAGLPLVLIHGWGNDSGVWEPLLPLLQKRFDVITLDIPGFGCSPACRQVDAVLDMMEAALPERFFLLGWSLGGMLATRFASENPRRVAKLITLATNACFTVHPGWSTAMDEKTFDSFVAGFDANPDRCLRQFSGLQSRGDQNERELLRWLRENGDVIQPEWRWSLEWLRELDNTRHLINMTIPALHLFGSHDQLVPVSVAEAIQGISPGSRVRVIEQTGHAPHLSSPGLVAQCCTEFLLGDEDPYTLDKRNIANSFSRAACSYDQLAHLQQEVGSELMAMIPHGNGITSIADIGCGTGFFTQKLAHLYPQATCIGVDLAPGMIAYAASHSEENIRWICADAEAMPLEGNSQDLLFSNFTFQWCHDLPAVMSEQYRALKPGGSLVFTTIGAQSLKELRAAWAQVDDYVHVNRFAPFEDVNEALAGAGFDVIRWCRKEIVRYYAQVGDLTRELKGVGAHNINRGRNSAVTGRRKIIDFMTAYEKYRQAQGLPLTWEVVYAVATKPAQ